MSRFPPPRFPPAPEKKKDEKSKAASEGTNALWRLPEWFPQFDSVHMEALRHYHSELLRFNGKLNLISRASEREADETHFADCLLAAQLMPKKLGQKVYDIGSGNGMPGLIFGLLYPATEFFLIDSDARKCEFIKHMAHELKLSNVEVLNIRLETLKGQPIETGVCRGFASISKTILMLNRSFLKGGRFYHMKGAGWSTEVGEIPSQLISSWRPELVGEYSLPSSQARRAVVCTLKVN